MSIETPAQSARADFKLQLFRRKFASDEGERTCTDAASGKGFPCLLEAVCWGRHKPFVMAASLREAPDVTQALAKAEQNAARARSAKTAQDREYYGQMRRTWLGLAHAWRVIADVDKAD